MLRILSPAEPKLPKRRIARLYGLKIHQATNTLTEHYPIFGYLSSLISDATGACTVAFTLVDRNNWVGDARYGPNPAGTPRR